MTAAIAPSVVARFQNMPAATATNRELPSVPQAVRADYGDQLDLAECRLVRRDGDDDDAEYPGEDAYSLLREEVVALVPGEVFGTQSDRVRIAYSNSVERIDEAFDRIEEWVEGR